MANIDLDLDPRGLRQERIKKLEELKQKGLEPYGGRFDRDYIISQAREKEAELKDKKIKLGGRIMALRRHGQIYFADLRDESGKIQIYIRRDTLGEEKISVFGLVDIGDFLGVEGTFFKTKTGELTLLVSDFLILSKSLRPLPEKWHGLKDVEIRYRQRYLDLLSNEKVRETFRLRSEIIAGIRSFLHTRGFIEVETPMTQPIPGGAEGRAFKTHHQALDMDLYLRIAPELYLKRLLVGGMEKIFELNRSFRNEGLSPRHNPEFTMLEVYQAYADYEVMMELTEELISEVAKSVLGKEKITYQGHEINLKRPWKREKFSQLMEEKFKINLENATVENLVAELKRIGLDKEKLEKGLSKTQLLKILADGIAPEDPTFVIDHLASFCPLAKRHRDDKNLTQRFELFIGGLEVANAYSELNDPLEQRERLYEQWHELREEEKREKKIDDEFILALEYGMPPAGGLGIGIDRLVMLLTDSPTIREVVFFPQLKPAA